MASLNKVQIIGHLGKDPEIRYAASGDAVANITVATSESWKDKATGEKKEKTEWHRCTVWGKLAEICGEYLKKGAQVYFEGRLETRKWTDKDGVDRYTTEIKVDQMVMLGGKSNGGGEREERPAPAVGGGSKPAPKKQQGGFDDMDDDIPF